MNYEEVIAHNQPLQHEVRTILPTFIKYVNIILHIFSSYIFFKNSPKKLLTFNSILISVKFYLLFSIFYNQLTGISTSQSHKINPQKSQLDQGETL